MYPKYAPHQTDEAPLIAPGPPNMLGIGSTLRLRNNRLNAFLALRNRYGDVVRFQVGKRIIHLVSHPDLAKYVLQDNNRNYTKGRGLEVEPETTITLRPRHGIHMSLHSRL